MTYVRSGTVQKLAFTTTADVAGIADDVARGSAALNGVVFAVRSRSRQDGYEGGGEGDERETHGV